VSSAFALSITFVAVLLGPAAAQLTDLQPGRNYTPEANFGLNSSENIDFGDADNDGDMDAIVGNGGDSGPQPNRIFINRGGLQAGVVGTFIEETSTRFAGVPNDTSRDIEFVDLDNDGDLDVYVANRGTTTTGEVSRFYVNLGGPQAGTIGFYAEDTNNRWGTLISVPAAQEVDPDNLQGAWRDWACDCDFADLDDDGWTDLFHSTYGPNMDGTDDSRIFLNDTTGVFDELWPWCFGVQDVSMDLRTHTLDLDLVDLDGDFDIDVTMSSRNSQGRIYLNNLNNGISASAFNDITQFALVAQGIVNNGGANYEGEFGDLDGDGDFDIWFKNWNANTDRIMRNDGFTAGSGVLFTQQNNWIKNDPNADENEVDFVDFDGDGDLDSFVANFSGTNHLYVSGLAQGLNPATTGLFHRAGISALYPQGELPTGTPGGLTTLDGETADVDNDGDQDLAVANDANQQNYLYVNSLGIPDTHAPTFHAVTNQADKANGSSTVIHVALRDNTSYYVVQFYDVNLEYTVDGGSPVSVDMFAQGSMQFRGVIPAQTDATVAYHVEATDLAGNTGLSADLDYVQGAVVGGPWTDIGCSLAGVSGPPLLVGTGPLTPGSAGALNLSNAAPSAASVLYIASMSLPVNFQGGTLCAFPFMRAIPLVTDPAGTLTLSWTSWPSGLSGVTLYFQYAITDAAGPVGASLSNAVKGVVP